MKTLSVLLLFLVLAFVSGAHETASAAPLNEAEITRILNKVFVQKTQDDLRPASLNETVIGTDLVATGPKSRAELLFPDKTITRLGANTAFSFRPGTREFEIRKGTMLLQVPKNAGGATVRTAAISAAITGTTIMVEHTPGNHAKFVVLEGTMRIYQNQRVGESTLLTPGKMLIVPPNAKTLPKPVNVDLSRLVKTSKLVSGMDEAQSSSDLEPGSNQGNGTSGTHGSTTSDGSSDTESGESSSASSSSGGDNSGTGSSEPADSSSPSGDNGGPAAGGASDPAGGGDAPADQPPAAAPKPRVRVAVNLDLSKVNSAITEQQDLIKQGSFTPTNILLPGRGTKTVIVNEDILNVVENNPEAQNVRGTEATTTEGPERSAPLTTIAGTTTLDPSIRINTNPTLIKDGREIGKGSIYKATPKDRENGSFTQFAFGKLETGFERDILKLNQHIDDDTPISTFRFENLRLAGNFGVDIPPEAPNQIALVSVNNLAVSSATFIPTELHELFLLTQSGNINVDAPMTLGSNTDLNLYARSGGVAGRGILSINDSITGGLFYELMAEDSIKLSPDAFLDAQALHFSTGFGALEIADTNFDLTTTTSLEDFRADVQSLVLNSNLDFSGISGPAFADFTIRDGGLNEPARNLLGIHSLTSSSNVRLNQLDTEDLILNNGASINVGTLTAYSVNANTGNVTLGGGDANATGGTWNIGGTFTVGGATGFVGLNSRLIAGAIDVSSGSIQAQSVRTNSGSINAEYGITSRDSIRSATHITSGMGDVIIQSGYAGNIEAPNGIFNIGQLIARGSPASGLGQIYVSSGDIGQSSGLRPSLIQADGDIHANNIYVQNSITTTTGTSGIYTGSGRIDLNGPSPTIHSAGGLTASSIHSGNAVDITVGGTLELNSSLTSSSNIANVTADTFHYHAPSLTVSDFSVRDFNANASDTAFNLNGSATPKGNSLNTWDAGSLLGDGTGLISFGGALGTGDDGFSLTVGLNGAATFKAGSGGIAGADFSGADITGIGDGGEGGDFVLTSSGSLSFDSGGNIYAKGGSSPSGGNGGDGGSISFDVDQVIADYSDFDTSGGDSYDGIAGDGGDINITANSGFNYQSNSIRSEGGNDLGSSGQGGDGGHININGSANSFITAAATLDASGGNSAGFTGGNGGTITIHATNGSSGNVSTPTVDLQGGSGTIGGNGGTLSVTSDSGNINVAGNINAKNGTHGSDIVEASGGTVILDAGGAIDVGSSYSIEVGDTATFNKTKVGGEINLTSSATSGVSINVQNSSQLLALVDAASTQRAGRILLLADGGGSIDIAGTLTANKNSTGVAGDRSLIDVRNTANHINIANTASLMADIIKVGALAPNGNLLINGGTFDANTTLKLYGGTATGMVQFTGNTTLSGAAVKHIRANTVEVNNGVNVNVTGGSAVNVYANTHNYNTGGYGNFTGDGAVNAGTPGSAPAF